MPYQSARKNIEENLSLTPLKKNGSNRKRRSSNITNEQKKRKRHKIADTGSLTENSEQFIKNLEQDIELPNDEGNETDISNQDYLSSSSARMYDSDSSSAQMSDSDSLSAQMYDSDSLSAQMYDSDSSLETNSSLESAPSETLPLSDASPMPREEQLPPPICTRSMMPNIEDKRHKNADTGSLTENSEQFIKNLEQDKELPNDEGNETDASNEDSLSSPSLAPMSDSDSSSESLPSEMLPELDAFSMPREEQLPPPICNRTRSKVPYIEDNRHIYVGKDPTLRQVFGGNKPATNWRGYVNASPLQPHEKVAIAFDEEFLKQSGINKELLLANLMQKYPQLVKKVDFSSPSPGKGRYQKASTPNGTLLTSRKGSRDDIGVCKLLSNFEHKSPQKNEHRELKSPPENLMPAPENNVKIVKAMLTIRKFIKRRIERRNCHYSRSPANQAAMATKNFVKASDVMRSTPPQIVETHNRIEFDLADTASFSKNAQWLHLLAHMFANNKTQNSNNMVAGTPSANEAQKYVDREIERTLKEFGKVGLTMMAELIPNSHVATKIHYLIHTPDLTIPITIHNLSMDRPKTITGDILEGIFDQIINLKTTTLDFIENSEMSKVKVTSSKIMKKSSLECYIDSFPKESITHIR